MASLATRLGGDAMACLVNRQYRLLRSRAVATHAHRVSARAFLKDTRRVGSDHVGRDKH